MLTFTTILVIMYRAEFTVITRRLGCWWNQCRSVIYTVRHLNTIDSYNKLINAFIVKHTATILDHRSLFDIRT